MNEDVLSSAAAQSILSQAIAPSELQADGSYYTSPPSWGVYEIAPSAQNQKTKRYRIGNHPVRQGELTDEFGKVKQIALFTSRSSPKSWSAYSTRRAKDETHLARLDSWIRGGKARHIFLSDKVFRLMRRSRAFPWLPGKPQLPGALPVIYAQPPRTVYMHLHFSNYGKFQQRLRAEAAALNALLLQRDG